MQQQVKQPNVKVIWQPIANTSQEVAISSPANETLYCGTRGCGKTDVQLMKFARNVGIGYGEYYRGIIFDREYKNLDDIVKRGKQWFKRIWGNKVRWLASKADYKFVWDTGEELLIRTMKTIDDYDDYHGQEYPFIGWNELTKHPAKDCYESMMSCNRTSFVPEIDAPMWARDASGKPTIPPIQLEIFSTTNPYGAGRGWVHRRFILGYEYGQLQRRSQMIYSPSQQKMVEHTTTRVAIFGHYKENKKLPDTYIATLGDMSNPNKRAAWLEGRWDVAAGGVFESCWDEKVHIVNNFTIPKGWEIFPTFDWGNSAPFAVTWWGVSNGEDCYIPRHDGTFSQISFPVGTMVLIFTWYGADDGGSGLRLGATEIALGMKEIERKFRELYFIDPRATIETGNADGQIFNKINSDDPTIADWFEKEGVTWLRADKSQGSRKNGLALMQERLLAAIKQNGRPAMYVMRRNMNWLDTVPTLPPDPKDPDDVDTEAEDHIYDCTRYAVLRMFNRLASDLSDLGTL